MCCWMIPWCVCVREHSLTCSGSWQQGDGEGQAQAGDMSRHHCRPPQPHIEPVLPHPQSVSQRTVLHVRPHAAGRLPAHFGCWWHGDTRLHDQLVTEEESSLKKMSRVKRDTAHFRSAVCACSLKLVPSLFWTRSHVSPVRNNKCDTAQTFTQKLTQNLNLRMFSVLWCWTRRLFWKEKVSQFPDVLLTSSHRLYRPVKAAPLKPSEGNISPRQSCHRNATVRSPSYSSRETASVTWLPSLLKGIRRSVRLCPPSSAMLHFVVSVFNFLTHVWFDRCVTS